MTTPKKKRYGYKPGGLWGTDPLYMASDEEGAWGYYWYHNDHLGTPKALTDETGRVVWDATADAFGSTTPWTHDVTNNLRFPGQYEDAETGLHYNYFRYYDPETGRYTREDPIRDGMNWYGYAGGNPTLKVDPMGLLAAIVCERCLKGSMTCYVNEGS
ncbi:MAG: hypothetical protein C0609_03830 [Deltaproteobacteria bacterium]|nr:MAG: hypothetical protein C0609_03830 [Deltaproteobacteria bacterium]